MNRYILIASRKQTFRVCVLAPSKEAVSAWCDSEGVDTLAESFDPYDYDAGPCVIAKTTNDRATPDFAVNEDGEKIPIPTSASSEVKVTVRLPDRDALARELGKQEWSGGKCIRVLYANPNGTWQLCEADQDPVGRYMVVVPIVMAGGVGAADRAADESLGALKELFNWK